MHQAPLDERIDFYRYTSATQFLDQARMTLREIKELPATGVPEWKVHGLWMAFFGFYAKPFKQQRDKELQVGLRLPEDIVPDEMKDTHRSILDLRDKMFAHTDFASLKADTGEALNALAIQVHRRMPVFGLRFILPTTEGVARYEKLLDTLIEKVAYRGTKIWNRWSRHLNLADGTTWIVNSANDNDDALLPYK